MNHELKNPSFLEKRISEPSYLLLWWAKIVKYEKEEIEGNIPQRLNYKSFLIFFEQNRNNPKATEVVGGRKDFFLQKTLRFYLRITIVHILPF